jgi:hypothetical protein
VSRNDIKRTTSQRDLRPIYRRVPVRVDPVDQRLPASGLRQAYMGSFLPLANTRYNLLTHVLEFSLAAESLFFSESSATRTEILSVFPEGLGFCGWRSRAY